MSIYTNRENLSNSTQKERSAKSFCTHPPLVSFHLFGA
ncbi:hypothetical protein BN938_2734 [Mucinivorans hirudinis]|uniref:Uncharacterized protein n=1 Tax=Mucinivorans hirudinis TaxID=1433126 RepID=A0A060RE52_9BACT|nr:hypothetical protein BN938_2734 [Mucinivorans hirudinis]